MFVDAELLQHVARWAAVSVLIASICFTMPAPAVARQQIQPDVQQVHQVPLQQQYIHTPSNSMSPQWLQSRQQEQQMAMLQTQEGSSTLTISYASPADVRLSYAAATALQDMVAPESNQQQTEHLLFTLSSQVEDGMLEAVRQLEAGFDRAFGAFGNSLHMMDAALASSEQVCY